MKKTFLSFLAIIFCIYVATAQKIGKSFLPPKTNEMPAWFQIFYDSDSYAKFNVKDLDEQFEAYEAKEKKAEEAKEKAAAAQAAQVSKAGRL